jgi:hypothetical protein
MRKLGSHRLGRRLETPVWNPLDALHQENLRKSSPFKESPHSHHFFDRIQQFPCQVRYHGTQWSACLELQIACICQSKIS